MNLFKKLLFILSDNLLRILVYATATTAVLALVAGNRSLVKQTIAESGAYQKFVPSIIESNKDNSTIPLSDPEVVLIINKAFPPETLKNKTEDIVDSIFNWLEGKESEVIFTVDFTENKNQLGDKLSEYAFTNLAFKDTCETQPEYFDPFTSECRPYGYDIFKGETEFADQIKSTEGFLGQTVLTQASLPANKSGKTIFEQYSNAPVIYKWLMRAPWILGVMTIISAVSFVGYLPNKRRGVARLGKTISATSVTLIVTPLIFSVIIPQFSKSFQSEISGSSAEVLFNDIITSLTRSFDRMMIGFGVWLLLIGIAILLGEKMTRPKTRYSGVASRSGLTSSLEPAQKLASPRGKIKPATLPMQSSEISDTKKPKKQKKNSKYRKIPI